MRRQLCGYPCDGSRNRKSPTDIARIAGDLRIGIYGGIIDVNTYFVAFSSKPSGRDLLGYSTFLFMPLAFLKEPKENIPDKRIRLRSRLLITILPSRESGRVNVQEYCKFLGLQLELLT